jgi:hypothetical protein
MIPEITEARAFSTITLDVDEFGLFQILSAVIMDLDEVEALEIFDNLDSQGSGVVGFRGFSSLVFLLSAYESN